ncbi:MAG TPA: hypothetical protein V6C65_06370 [Allocoleopsis sp.]
MTSNHVSLNLNLALLLSNHVSLTSNLALLNRVVALQHRKGRVTFCNDRLLNLNLALQSRTVRVTSPGIQARPGIRPGIQPLPGDRSNVALLLAQGGEEKLRQIPIYILCKRNR